MLLCPKSGITDFSVSPDGTCIASSGEDGWLRIWAAETGMGIDAVPLGFSRVMRAGANIFWSPESTRLFLRTPELFFWDTRRGRVSFARSLPIAGDCSGAAWSPESTRLAIGYNSGAIDVIDLESGHLSSGVWRLPLKPSGDPSAVLSLAFAPEGTGLAVCGPNGIALIVSLSNKTSLAYRGHMQDGPEDKILPFDDEGLPVVEAVNAVCWSPNGTCLATVAGKVVHVWGVRGETLYRCHHQDLVESVAFSPDGLRIASGAWDRTARIWDATDGRMLSEVRMEKPVNMVQWFPDGRLAVADRYDLTVFGG